MIKTKIALSLLATLFSVSAYSAEIFLVSQASLSFDTFVRVETAGKIIESEDATLVGTSLPYYQSLLYSASKGLQINRNFSSAAEIAQFVANELCQEIHTIELNAIRDRGAKGSQKLVAKIKPNTVTVNGTHVSNKGAKFSTNFTCQ